MLKAAIKTKQFVDFHCYLDLINHLININTALIDTLYKLLLPKYNRLEFIFLDRL